MKWISIIILLTLCLGGCVTAKYNPETTEVSYTRVGDQELGGVEIILADGSSISFEKQKSETKMFQDLLAVIKDAYLAGRVAGAP